MLQVYCGKWCDFCCNIVRWFGFLSVKSNTENCLSLVNAVKLQFEFSSSEIRPEMKTLTFLFLVCLAAASHAELLSNNDESLYVVEGRIFPAEGESASTWQREARILVNGGEYLGFLKHDGSFIISNLPSGSYIVEVAHPNYYYEPVRIEINTKGKFRARKLNHLQPSVVVQVPYPLKLKSLGRMRYFQQREQWRITDFLFSPMVLMMVLPLVLIMVLPKMMNDPETKKEMEQLNNMTKYDMPEMSEMITSFFSGREKPKPVKASKANKKRQ
ncbi:ER membrane protein complex subunit 7 homolog [Neocloeon triangulifer]|uniref:ER membrane protein complex subunit 7 homolog n=1 Tax=Neocloeon triangulifer TaxID=2078957 RepID=UPI00286F6EC1|nr:ER membrane protein complex subunit 7 homolog [Neocloeon triangulifer]